VRGLEDGRKPPECCGVSMTYIVEVEFGDILPRPATGLSVTPLQERNLQAGPSDEPSMVLYPFERLASRATVVEGFRRWRDTAAKNEKTRLAACTICQTERIG